MNIYPSVLISNVYVSAVISLLAGLGAFLIGFKLLSDNIEKLANSGLKKLFSKTAKNRFASVGIGATVTMIIQSSSAATVMIVGFVNAGLMDLFQATAMIMGANIGTTITAQIVALNAFDISQFLMIFLFIGMFMYILGKRDKTKTVGLALGGLGLVFLALKYMSVAMNVFKESEVFINLLKNCNNPLLLLLIGIIFTALIQSSSATTTILISMVGAGIAIGSSSNAILYVVLGSNIGTCVTALISSIGASPNAKRASIIHLLFNVAGALIFFVVLLCFPSFMDVTFGKWFALPETQLAMFHTFFNVAMTVLFLPFINLFVKASRIIVKEKPNIATSSLIDERFLMSPAIAISQVSKETLKMGQFAMETLNLSIEDFVNKTNEHSQTVLDNIKLIDLMNQNILSYLVKISSQDINASDESYLSQLHHNVNDFYREAEIADNMVKYTRKLLEGNIIFSDKVFEQIKLLQEKLNIQFQNVSELFNNRNVSLITEVDRIEDEIDSLRSSMINEHIMRLEKGECSPSASGIYINLVSNLERAGDHLGYIAHTIVD